MDMEDMTRWQARGWGNLLIWSVAGIVLGVLLFADGGPAGYTADGGGSDLGELVITVAMAASVVTHWTTRRLATDERDERVESRASRATVVVVALGVFVLGMILHDVYRARGTVPVGWLRLMQHGVFVVTFLAHPVSIHVENARFGGHVRG